MLGDLFDRFLCTGWRASGHTHPVRGFSVFFAIIDHLLDPTLLWAVKILFIKCGVVLRVDGVIFMLHLWD